MVPLTRTVADAALFLDLVAGPSPCDPGSLPAPGLSYREVFDSGLPASTRIAWSPDLGYARVQSDVGRVASQGVAAFEEAGFPVEPLEEHVAGGPPMLTAAWGALGNFFLAGQLHESLRNQRHDMTHSFAEALERSWQVTPESFGEGARERGRLNQWCSEVFDRFDLLVTPTVPYDPPPARGPFPTHTEGREQVPAGVAAFTIPFNMSGHPAATVRAGFSDAGLPVGLHIVGPRPPRRPLCSRPRACSSGFAPGTRTGRRSRTGLRDHRDLDRAGPLVGGDLEGAADVVQRHLVGSAGRYGRFRQRSGCATPPRSPSRRGGARSSWTTGGALPLRSSISGSRVRGPRKTPRTLIAPPGANAAAAALIVSAVPPTVSTTRSASRPARSSAVAASSDSWTPSRFARRAWCS